MTWNQSDIHFCLGNSWHEIEWSIEQRWNEGKSNVFKCSNGPRGYDQISIEWKFFLKRSKNETWTKLILKWVEIFRCHFVFINRLDGRRFVYVHQNALWFEMWAQFFPLTHCELNEQIQFQLESHGFAHWTLSYEMCPKGSHSLCCLLVCCRQTPTESWQVIFGTNFVDYLVHGALSLSAFFIPSPGTYTNVRDKIADNLLTVFVCVSELSARKVD